MIPSINCNGAAMVHGAAMLLILPLNWILAIFFAALFHELCHYLAIRLAGGKVTGVSITHNGAVMQVTPLSARQELVCSLAGPAGSILLFFCCQWIPRTALCAGVQGFFNLLPMYPLDGGRIYRILMNFWFPRLGARICRWTEHLMAVTVFLLGVWLSVGCRLGTGPIFLSLLLLSRVVGGKISCKHGKVRVQ